jgi:PAS domain S-box-containing protein
MAEPKDQKTKTPGRAALISFVTKSDLNLTMIDRDGFVLAVSKGGVSQFGTLPEGLIGGHVSAFIPADELTFLGDLAAGRLPQGPSPPRKVYMPDGQVQWVTSKENPWYDDDGSFGGVVSLTQNITAEQQAQVELGRAEALFEAVFDSIPAMVFVEDFPQPHRQRMNRASREFLGLSETSDFVFCQRGQYQFR